MNLAQLRKRAGLTQAGLAYQLGYTTPQLISNIERGICRMPFDKWKKAAKVLGVKPEVFLSEHMAHTKRKLEKALGFVTDYGR